MSAFKVIVWDHDSPATVLCVTDNPDKAKWISDVFDGIGCFTRIEEQ